MSLTGPEISKNRRSGQAASKQELPSNQHAANDPREPKVSNAATPTQRDPVRDLRFHGFEDCFPVLLLQSDALVDDLATRDGDLGQFCHEL